MADCQNLDVSMLWAMGEFFFVGVILRTKNYLGKSIIFSVLFFIFLDCRHIVLFEKWRIIQIVDISHKGRNRAQAYGWSG